MATNHDFRDRWIPIGEEPHPAGSITSYTILRNDGISVVSLPSGEIDAARHLATGMYYRDTRHLSLLALSFRRIAPVLLDAREFEHALTAIFTNPGIQTTESGTCVPPQSLILRRRRVLETALVESLTISNYGHETLDVELYIDFDADFQDIFVVRGLERASQPPPVSRNVEGDHVEFTYTGVDGVRRSTVVGFRPIPARLEQGCARYSLRLEPRHTSEIDIVVTTGQHLPMAHATDADERARQREQAWLHTLTRIETNDETVNAALNRSMLDIYALRTRPGNHEYLAAGVPWFDTLFGRDSLIASMEMAALTPELLKMSLEVLAHYQADETDPAHDATPGKIPHEIRWGELAQADEVPFGRYYGSVDATPLFVAAAYEYFRWTADRETLRRLWPHIRRAMEWCCERIATDRNGFLSYERKSRLGLENQGWKDSHDAIIWPDGQMVEPPIALIEVQAYVAAAAHAYAELAPLFAEPGAPGPLLDVGRFVRSIDAAFGHPELGYVLCLDGNGQAVPTPASNAAHALWVGAARPDFARNVAHFLMRPAMFSGWGVRTLGTTVARYNPLGYHVGAVWPHDNAIALAGFRRYGLEREALTLASALLDAALAFPNYCVPELFSGDARELRHVPTPYPVSSRPQAWAAASLPYALVSMLGIRPGPPGQVHVVRPALPRQLEWVRVHNLRLGNGSVDLEFHRHAGTISVEAQNLRGLEVVLSGAQPDTIRPNR